MRTGICANCGKKKEEHWPISPKDGFYPCNQFTDSGLARLHEHAEELYEAATIASDNPCEFTATKLKEVLKKINPLL